MAASSQSRPCSYWYGLNTVFSDTKLGPTVVLVLVLHNGITRIFLNEIFNDTSSNIANIEDYLQSNLVQI